MTVPEKIFFYLTLCLFGASLSSGWAQINNSAFLFDKLHLQDGVHYNPITAIAQDGYGLIWFGTDGYGLHRYDGYSLESFNNQDEIVGGIPGSYIQSLYESNQNGLWVGFRYEGAAFYDQLTRQFMAVSPPAGYAENFSVTAFLTTTQLGNEEVWMASPALGLLRVQKKQERLTAKHFANDTIKNAYSLLALDEQSFFVGTKGHLFFFEKKQLQYSYKLEAELEDLPITSMAIDPDGNLWLGTNGGGVLLFDHLQRLPLKTFDFSKMDSKASSNSNMVTSLLKDTKNNMWVTTLNGVFIAEHTGFKDYHFQVARNDEYQKHTLNDNQAFSAFEDNNESIWLGTYRGLNFVNEFKIKFTHHYHNPKNPATISDNFVTSIWQSDEGLLWVGTRDGKLNLLDRAGQTCAKIEVKVPGSNAVAITYKTLKIPKLNEYLIATSAGLFSMSSPTSKIVFIPSENNTSLIVWDILNHTDGLILLATNQGLWQFLPDKNLVVPFKPESSISLPKGLVRVLLQDPEGLIWIGAVGEVTVLDLALGKTQKFPINKKTAKDILVDLPVISMSFVDDNLWIGTRNGGIFSLNTQKHDTQGGILPELSRITQQDGLQNNTIHGILPESPMLWISTNMGIGTINLLDTSFAAYHLYDGVQDNEFNPGAHFKSASGEMFFGGINGFNAFFPEKVMANPHPPKVVFTKIQVLNQAGQREKTYKEISLIGKKEINIPYKANVFTVYFTGSHYAYPPGNEFYYKLEGLDDAWIYNSNKHFVGFSGLKPGKYHLKVRGINADGTFGEWFSSLQILITPPFWQQWWFLFLLVISVSGIVWLLIQRKLRKNTIYRKKLEREVALRTQAIIAQKQVIEKQLRELTLSREQLEQLNQKKDTIFSILSHDLRSPLNTLQGFLGILMDLIELGDKEQVKSHTSKIQESVAAILSLIDNILFWSQAERDNLKYNPKPFLLNPLLDKTLTLYKLVAENKKIDLSKQINGDIYLNADDSMVFLIVRNLLSNAIKFTPYGGKVTILAAENGRNTNITIKDTGVGLSKDEIGKLLDEKEYFSKPGTAQEKGTGIGFNLCKKFVKLNKGKLKIESTPGKGSAFTISLPKHQKKIGQANRVLLKDL